MQIALIAKDQIHVIGLAEIEANIAPGAIVWQGAVYSRLPNYPNATAYALVDSVIIGDDDDLPSTVATIAI